MKYAVAFNRNFRYIDIVDEIILNWSIKDDIVDYAQEKYTQNQRVIIAIDNLIDFEEKIFPILAKLNKVHSNMAVRLDTIDDDIIYLLKENNIKYYFNQFCSNWDAVYGMSLYGVSDVTIVEELCFDIKAVSAFCKPRGIKVRVFPNVAQVGGRGFATKIQDIKKFFIRPEDTKVYEKYVDVFEIWGDLSKQSVLFEIYKQEQWLGNLNNIITDFTDDVPNSGFMNHFAGCRLSCRKKCMQGDNKCNICKTMKDIAIALNNDGLMISSMRQPLRENTKDIEELLDKVNSEKDEDE